MTVCLFGSGASHGIGVILDVHAANGSQNGFHHSAPVVVNGQGQQQWDSRTQLSPSYPAQAGALVATLAARYGASPALLGFSVLNEPTVRFSCVLCELNARPLIMVSCCCYDSRHGHMTQILVSSASVRRSPACICSAGCSLLHSLLADADYSRDVFFLMLRPAQVCMLDRFHRDALVFRHRSAT